MQSSIDNLLKIQGNNEDYRMLRLPGIDLKSLEISRYISGGGAHCDASLHTHPNGQRYIIKDYSKKPWQSVKQSLSLAEGVGWDLVIPFTTLDGAKIVQELNLPLNEVISEAIKTLEANDAALVVESCIARFFEVNQDLIHRGVFNWDPTLENFCINTLGQIRLCDVGGLVSRDDVIEEISAPFEGDDANIPYSLLKLRKGIPEGARATFNRLQDVYGFGNGSTLATLIKKAHQTD